MPAKLEFSRAATILCLLLLQPLTTAKAGAQEQPEAASSKGQIHSTRVILLGTGGGPLNRKQRSQPASLLVVDGHPYLIDAGAGVVVRLAQAGFPASRIDRIFMTHDHLDHSAGLPALMSFIWMDRNREKLNEAAVQIYGPPATESLIQSALGFLSVSERIFAEQLPSTIASPSMFGSHRVDHDGVVYRDARLCVVAVENTHYHFSKGSPADKAGDKSYSYRFNTVGGSVVFTGDTGPSDAVTRLADHADLLVSEVVNEAAIAPNFASLTSQSADAAAQVRFHMLEEHLSSEEVGKMASRANVGAVLLTHFVPGLDSESDPTAYTNGVSGHYSGPVIPGRDLLEYDLHRRGGSADASCT